MVWVPGHSGIEGNEKADELARQGSAAVSYGPEPFIPIPQSLCDKALRKWTRSELARHWKDYQRRNAHKAVLPGVCRTAQHGPVSHQASCGSDYWALRAE